MSYRTIMLTVYILLTLATSKLGKCMQLSNYKQLLAITIIFVFKEQYR